MNLNNQEENKKISILAMQIKYEVLINISMSGQ